MDASESRAKELGLKGALSCCQGAVIMDIETGKPLLNGVLSNAVTVEICRKMEEMHLHIHAYGFTEYYCNMDDDALKFYESAVRVKAKLVLDKPMSKFIEEKGLASYKILAMVKAEDNERISKALAAENFEGCEITKSDNFLVEVINAKYSKGTAVEFLANYYQAPLEKTVAIGDQLNDLPMIEKAGLGVAVKNADGGLKKRADYIAEYTNEEGAVGKIIEKFGFTE
jgi:Cof subfamily protein (haloacid dehalogenase superfamily)